MAPGLLLSLLGARLTRDSHPPPLLTANYPQSKWGFLGLRLRQFLPLSMYGVDLPYVKATP